MGILDFLKGAGKVGAVVAAPFTGGASLAAIPALNAFDKVGAAAGGAANAMAHNRGTKAGLMLDQNDALEQQLLAREREKRDARSSSYRDMMVGANTMNWQPNARPAGMAPSRRPPMSEQGQVAGGALYNQALARMGAPDLSTHAGNSGMPAYRNLANDKDFKNTQKSGIMEKLLGIGSVAAPFVGSYFNKDKPVSNG